ADLDGWQHLLADALATEPAASRLRDELAPQLARFAASELRGRLAAAVVRLRDAEFLTDWPVEGEPGPGIAGTIDLLWQDVGNDWHLLAWDTEPTTGGSDPWRGRRLALAVQAWAAQSQLGRAVRTVALYSFADGKLTQADGRRLPFAQVF